MYYLYILKSLSSGRRYIGSAEDTQIRLKQHNQKSVRSTKAFTPWQIIYTEEYKTKTEAQKREKELKKNAWRRKDLFDKIDRKK